MDQIKRDSSQISHGPYGDNFMDNFDSLCETSNVTKGGNNEAISVHIHVSLYSVSIPHFCFIRNCLSPNIFLLCMAIIFLCVLGAITL